MNDFRREPEELLSEERTACERVLHSGWYILGKEVEAFEGAWAQHCQVAHAIGVGNGLDAIEIGLRACGIGPGDEVITTAMTAFATVLAIHRAGATPVLADIDPTTGLMERSSVERCLTKRSKAIILVHLYGQLVDPDSWRQWSDEHGLLLLEDCAQAHGSLWSGRPAGTFGTAGAYSFYPTKNLGCRGDGGALVTDDPAIAASARSLRNYGQQDRYRHAVLGLNSRLDELQAAILQVRLRWLERFNARRRAIADRYRKQLGNPLVEVMAPPLQAASSNSHLFVVLCDRRDDLMAFLHARHISPLCHYPIPIHLQAPCLEIRRDTRGLVHSERHAARCCSLPCNPQMDEDDIGLVIESVNAFR